MLIKPDFPVIKMLPSRLAVSGLVFLNELLVADLQIRFL